MNSPAPSADAGRSLPPLVEEFLGHYESPQTRRTYGQHLRDLVGFLGRRGIPFPAGVSRAVAVEYRDTLTQERRYSRDTAYQRFVAARQFFQSLIARQAEEGVRPGEPELTGNPFDRIRRPKPPARFGKTDLLEKEDVKLLLEAPDAASPIGRRDLLCLYLLFNMGLRTSEVVRTRMQDVRPEGSETTLVVERKGQEVQALKVPAYVVPLVRRVIEDLGRKSGPLFVRMYLNGRMPDPVTAMTPAALRRMVAKYARRAGVNAGGVRIRPHCGRTFFINEVYARTGSARKAQLAAGHASITTTERYLRKGGQRDDDAVDYVRLPLPRPARRHLERS